MRRSIRMWVPSWFVEMYVADGWRLLWRTTGGGHVVSRPDGAVLEKTI
jgi:hypothetical protein